MVQHALKTEHCSFTTKGSLQPNLCSFSPKHLRMSLSDGLTGPEIGARDLDSGFKLITSCTAHLQKQRLQWTKIQLFDICALLFALSYQGISRSFVLVAGYSWPRSRFRIIQMLLGTRTTDAVHVLANQRKD